MHRQRGTTTDAAFLLCEVKIDDLLVADVEFRLSSEVCIPSSLLEQPKLSKEPRCILS